MMNISKELLSEVLNIEREIEHIDFIEKWNTFIYYVDGGAERTINIYELQHKCKIWAYKNGFILRSEYYPPDSFLFSGGCLLVNISTEESMWFNGTLEPKANFTACQWVLDNKDKQ